MWTTIWKIIKWIFCFFIPIVLALIIYVLFSGIDYSTISFGWIIRVLPAASEEILSHYPFVEFIAKYFEKTVSVKEITVQVLTDGVLKALITYGTVDLIKRYYEMRSDTAKAVKIVITYGSIVILIAYIAGLLVDYGFDYLEKWIAGSLQLQITKVLLLLIFFAIAVARFYYTTHKSFLFSTIWVFMDKIFYGLLSCVLLTTFALWAHSIIFEDNVGIKWNSVVDIVPIFLIYILFAALIDYLKQRTRYWITSNY